MDAVTSGDTASQTWGWLCALPLELTRGRKPSQEHDVERCDKSGKVNRIFFFTTDPTVYIGTVYPGGIKNDTLLNFLNFKC